MCFNTSTRGAWRPSPPPPRVLPSVPFTRRERRFLIVFIILIFLGMPLFKRWAESRAADRAQAENLAHRSAHARP